MRLKLTLFLLFHLLLGFFGSQIANFTFYYGILVLFGGSVNIVSSRNGKNQAAIWAAYFMGLEVFLRMTNGSVFWEAGKYGVCLFLFLGLLVELRSFKISAIYVIFFLLLLPSILIIDFPDFNTGRQEVSFTLSGPLTLTFSAIYFYKRRFDSNGLTNILRAITLPLVSMVIYVILKVPDLSEIQYSSQSNFAAAGGFGPNQVSAMIGLGVFLVGTLIYYKRSLSGYTILDIAILLIFAIRGLSTFSRGGMLGGVLGLAILIFVSVFTAKHASSSLRTFSFLLLALPIGLYAWDYVSEATKGKLEYRYTGRNVVTGKDKDISSGRATILAIEIKSFLDNPVLGIGPGMGLMRNNTIFDKEVHSHSEYSRLLAEHGIFGIIALLILLISPVVYIFQLEQSNRALPLAIYVYVLFTMFHAAMRLAMPGFLYGLCFLIVVPVVQQRSKEKQRSISEKV